MSKKIIKRIAIMLVVLLLLLIILKYMGVIGKEEALKVAVAEVTTEDIVEEVSASGKLYPETEVKIKSDVSGEIVEIYVEEGDSVRKGQLLLKINPKIYNDEVERMSATVQQMQAGVMSSQEQMQQAKAQFERAKANFERNQKLYQDKVISPLEYEQLQADFLAAKATYEASKANVSSSNFGTIGATANLSQAKENLRRTTIVAPSDGIVSKLNVKQGERVVGTAQMDGTHMLSIADLISMEVQVEVSESDITKVKLGDSVNIEVDAYGEEKFKGLVAKISISSSNTDGQNLSTVKDQVSNYVIRIRMLPESYAHLTASQHPFKPGMSASVDIQTKAERNVLAVPVNAVTVRTSTDTTASGKPSTMVFVLDEATQTVKTQKVKTGIQNTEYIQITEGLQKGDKVVVAPYSAIARKLENGMKVTVVAKEMIYEVSKN